MIKVYQLEFTPDEVDEINKRTPFGQRLVDLRLEIYNALLPFPASNNTTVLQQNPDRYRMVALVATDDLEECFRLMNVWDEPERVHLLVDNAISMSVTDIAVKSDGTKWACAATGWVRLPDDMYLPA